MSVVPYLTGGCRYSQRRFGASNGPSISCSVSAHRLAHLVQHTGVKFALLASGRFSLPVKTSANTNIVFNAANNIVRTILHSICRVCAKQALSGMGFRRIHKLTNMHHTAVSLSNFRLGMNVTRNLNGTHRLLRSVHGKRGRCRMVRVVTYPNNYVNNNNRPLRRNGSSILCTHTGTLCHRSTGGPLQGSRRGPCVGALCRRCLNGPLDRATRRLLRARCFGGSVSWPLGGEEAVSRVGLTYSIIGRIHTVYSGRNGRPNRLVGVLRRTRRLRNCLPRRVRHVVTTRLNVPMSHICNIIAFCAFFAVLPGKGRPVSIYVNATYCIHNSRGLLRRFGHILNVRINRAAPSNGFSLSYLHYMNTYKLTPMIVVNRGICKELRPVSIGGVLRRLRWLVSALQVSVPEGSCLIRCAARTNCYRSMIHREGVLHANVNCAVRRVFPIRRTNTTVSGRVVSKRICKGIVPKSRICLRLPTSTFS